MPSPGMSAILDIATGSGVRARVSRAWRRRGWVARGADAADALATMQRACEGVVAFGCAGQAHDPARAFAEQWRAAHLALVLEERDLCAVEAIGEEHDRVRDCVGSDESDRVARRRGDGRRRDLALRADAFEPDVVAPGALRPLHDLTLVQLHDVAWHAVLRTREDEDRTEKQTGAPRAEAAPATHPAHRIDRCQDEPRFAAPAQLPWCDSEYTYDATCWISWSLSCAPPIGGIGLGCSFGVGTPLRTICWMFCQDGSVMFSHSESVRFGASGVPVASWPWQL